jgi:hypothetical protein
MAAVVVVATDGYLVAVFVAIADDGAMLIGAETMLGCRHECE